MQYTVLWFSKGPALKQLEIDILVLGGGVQGLTLSRDLRQQHSYSVLLLEINKLGGGQTCHSHVFIHEGHLCRKPSLMREFKQGHDQWQGLLASNLPSPSNVPIVLGFDDELDALEQQCIWKSFKPPLDAERRRVPDEFGTSCLRRAFEARVHVLTSESIVAMLLKGVADSVAKIECIVSFRVQARAVQDVIVRFSGAEDVVIKPQAVVLAAGAGNQELLEKLSVDRASGAQRNRQANMLVLAASGALELPGLGGHYLVRGNGISIAPRYLDGRVVWLVSDSRVSVESHIAQSQARWVENVCDDLRELAPSLFSNPANWKWALHRAKKAEGWQVYRWPYSGRIEQFGIDNLWTVWPSFLTLAPLLSRRVCEEIRKKLGANGRKHPKVEPFWKMPECSEEYWKENLRSEQLQDWNEFSRSNGLDGGTAPPGDDVVYGS
jgi:glycine/D-amino acid oxidase-like deaminating enzyme